MNSAPELLPCPCCSGEAEKRGRFDVKCSGCGLEINSLSPEKDWNRRPAALAKQGSPPADERVNCGTPPDRIWVHPWREMLYYSPTDQPDYIEYTRVSALVEKDKEIKELHTALADQRRQLGADYDKLNDELGRVRIAAYGEIQRLQTALEAARTSEKP